MPDGTDSRYQFEVGPEHVGARLLDIVSGALYGNVLDILREYIQNAVDAGASRIRLVLRDNEIWIWDDGAGLTPIALDNARKVAVSGKRADDVGFRGIGVYSSYMSCDGLELITRPTGEQTVHVLRLDFKGMREEVEKRSAADPPESLSLQEALSTFTEIGPYEGDAPLDDGKPFALVRLRNPDSHLVDALEDTSGLTKYLRSAVPLNFPPGHPHAERVLEGLRQHGLERRAINIDLTPRGKDPSKEGVAHPFYLSDFNRLLRPVVVEVHGGGRKVAVLWYSVHQERFVLPEGESGLQVRLKGFGIGDISLPEKVWGAAGSGILYRHLVGEVHVVDPRLRPSAERSNFEDSPARRELMSSLQKRFGTVGRWIQRRQTVLGGVERGQTITPEQQAELDRLSKSYGSVPPLAGVEILDTPGKRVHDAPKPTGDGSGGEGSSSGGPEDEGGGSGQDSGGEGGAGGEAGVGEGGTSGEGGSGGGEGSSTGEGGDGAGGGGGQGGDGSGGGTTTDTSPPKPPAPTIAKMLFDIPLRWPNGAGLAFGALDEAVREELPADTANAVRGGIRDRLAKLTFPSRRRKRR